MPAVERSLTRIFLALAFFAIFTCARCDKKDSARDRWQEELVRWSSKSKSFKLQCDLSTSSGICDGTSRARVPTCKYPGSESGQIGRLFEVKN